MRVQEGGECEASDGFVAWCAESILSHRIDALHVRCSVFSVRKHPKKNTSLPFQQLFYRLSIMHRVPFQLKHTDRFLLVRPPPTRDSKGRGGRLQLMQCPVIGLLGRWTDTHIQVTTWGIVTSEAICHADSEWTPWENK